MTRTARLRLQQHPALRLLVLALTLVLVTGHLVMETTASPARAAECTDKDIPEPFRDDCIDGDSSSDDEDCAGPASDYCKSGGKEEKSGCDYAPEHSQKFCDDGKGEDKKKDSGPPAGGPPGMSDAMDELTPECKSAPTPASPGRGDASWAQQEPEKAPAPISTKSDSATAHIYEQYGLSGLEWHTYDLACDSPSDTLTMMNKDYTTQIANWALGASRWWTSLAIGMQQEATSNGYISKIYDVSADATKEIRDAVYKPWIGISILVLGLTILYSARRKAFADTTKTITWALLVMAVAAVGFGYPQQVGKLADDAIVQTVGQIQQGVAGDVTKGSTPGTSQGNLLTKGILYEGWLRGEFGDSDSKVAKKYGMPLLDAQSLTWAESRLPDEERNKVIEAKKKTFQGIAAKVKKEDPDAYEYLTGRAGGRLSAAGETAIGATPANLYSFASSSLIVSARLIIPTALIFLPAIAVLALHRRLSGTLRTLGSSVGAAIINAPLMSLGASIEIVAVKVLFADNEIPAWFAAVLLWILSVMLWVMTKPLRRLNAMLSPNTQWFGNGIGAMSKTKAALGGAALGYVKGRMTARQIGRMVNGRKGGKSSQPDPDASDEGSLAGDLAPEDRQQSQRPPDFNDLSAANERAAWEGGEGPDYEGEGYRWGDDEGWQNATGAASQTASTTAPSSGSTAAPGGLFVPAPAPAAATGPDHSEGPTTDLAPSTPSTPSAPSAPSAPVVSPETTGRGPSPSAPPAPRAGTDTAVVPTAGGTRAPGAPSSQASRGSQQAAASTPPGAWDEPAGSSTDVEGDRPAPFQAPTVTGDDGQQVFVIYSPSSSTYEAHRPDGYSTPDQDGED
ncbi:hypothetical protein [Streptomyces sp. 891-h]|uniref:hypothetical protein n=1 Tax=Streptomyces sp. 891-h TaxID=2720714 RepID=UPI001FA98CE5|nr:hypothetical protein [Streptomyces sp. 891-h]UNZ22300.1 hypothetical protein HC362_34600 [Streptomyces sp. 891-h]